jgi:hypothetical protein
MIKKTITSIFIVPTLNFPKDSLKSNGFINGYIKDDRKDTQYENAVYILFKPDDLDKFREFLDSEYERTKSVIEDYDYEDGFVVVVYELDKKYKKDYELVKAGKYSQTSKAFQNEFPKSVKIIKSGLSKDEISLQTRIFKKSQDLIEFWEERIGISFEDEYEVWEGFDESKEVLEIDKIKELCLTEKS